VPHDERTPSSAELRAFLADQLAEYMVPAAFVVLPALPLTPNGKLDRQALPAPDQAALATRAYEAPLGEVETTLAAIWQQLLGIERVGRNDHFFELGGHSLLVISLIEQLRQQGWQAQVQTVFTSPTLVAMAAALERGTAGAFAVPDNRIPAGCTAITPDMLPLVSLTQDGIDRIAAEIPGGARDIQDIYPLAPLQEGILFHHLLGTEGDAYLVRTVLTFDSRERVERFVGALQAVIDRHDILRSSVHWDGLPQPVQVVHRAATLQVDTLALCTQASVHARIQATPEADPLQQLLDATDPRTQRLDLRRAPLMRATVVEDRACDRWLLSLLDHHMVSDHVTMDFVLEEIRMMLHGDHANLPSALPSALPYRNFIAQTRAVEPAGHEAYFRTQLADIDEPTAPFDVLDVQGDGRRNHSVRLPLASTLAQRIRTCASERGVTAAVLFHAAWALVLARCTARDDVVFGTVLSGRMQGTAAADRVLGMFVNTLPVRISVAQCSAAELVDQTYQRLSELLAHEQASLALAQRCSAVPASVPLFTALLNYRHSPVMENDGDAGEFVCEGVRMLSVEERTNYPLDLTVDDFGADFALTLQCAPVSALDPQRIAGYLAVAVQALVDALLDGDHQPARQLQMLPQTERELLLVGFNDTAVDYPHDTFVHALFERQVEAMPEAVAAVFGDEQVAYRELGARANQLAHHLLSLGVRPDDRVAICVERGIDMLVGLLGIMKAGAAYVPLDPTYPADRLAYMLEDCAPVAVLSQRALRDVLPAHGVPTLMLDDGETRDALARLPVDNLQAAALGLEPTSLAYVIYTSGSTGKPKGVMIEHRSAVNLLRSMAIEPGIAATDSLLAVTTLSFDIAALELYLPLANGACCVIASREDAADPRRLIDLIARRGITLMQATPVTWRMLLDAGWAGSPTLRALCGGEALPRDLSERLRDRVGSLWNMYGPTETTIWSSCAQIGTALAGATPSEPVGHPIGATQIYVLDERFEPVPVGVAGELYIGGIGVARGYLNRPELTAERFVADPFSDEPDARLYKTGDLARFLADGNIEYLGRNDFQVKIRGLRIELGEIETKLAACDGVRQAVVIAREDTPGDKRLVAYLAADDVESVSAAELRVQLAAQLPEYMVPGAFVVLPELPLTPNLKIDRRALPAPDASSVVTRSYEAPQGDIETALAAIWQQLLGLERVGRNDHFFELGGHSLLAVQLLSRLRQQFDAEVALRELFAQPTLDALARIVAQASRAGLAPIERRERSLPLALSFAQQRLWFLDRLDHAAGAAYHMPAALRLSGTLQREALRATLDRLIERHEILRTSFAMHEGQTVQRIAAPAAFALAETDLRTLDTAAQQAEVERLSQLEASAPFDLATGPLIRGQLLQLGEHEHILLVTQHHIISDGWSIGLLIDEVSTLYAAFCQQQPDPLPAQPVQYADYAAWQRQWLHGEVLQQQLGFWKSHLLGAPALLELPTDRQRPAVQSYAGASVPFALPAQLSASLRMLSQQHGTTLFMTLLAGWSVLLARLANQQEVVIGTPVANRPRAELEKLLGFFVNTLALRVNLEHNPSVSQLLSQVRETALAAYAHQDLPFEQVVEALQPARTLSHSPVFQVMLSMDNTPDVELSLPGLVLAAVPQAQTTTQFDLSLALSDDGIAISGKLEYAQSLFDAATVERFARHFQTLLTAMTADANQTIGSLALLDDQQRKQLLIGFNDTAIDSAQDGFIHELFQQQAAQTPNALAISDAERSLTYRELDRLSNRVAQHLKRLGVAPDARVGLYVERGVELVVGLLGVLKAGGAYVPLDPAYPAERIAYMLADSTPTAVLVHAGTRALISDADFPLLDLEAAMSDWNEVPDSPVSHHALSPSSLAYVIYTSGSTGKPKGVMVEQRGLRNLMAWYLDDLKLARGDAVLLVTSPSFDLTQKNILGPLLVGGTLHLAAPRFDPHAIVQQIGHAQIRHLNLSPSAFHALIDAAAGTTQLGGLRRVVLGGEPIQAARLAMLPEPRPEFINSYGPTECSDVVGWHRLSSDLDAYRTAPVPLGKPVRNLRLYVLDARGEPVPVGVAGELYIGGVGVARGYLNLPELTAERFIADPFSDRDDARLYKTGDLARFLADGNIEYLGRNDFQVKIRGQRIELGEIEAKLAACEGVREAVVIAREDSPGDKRLVAYLAADDVAAVAVAELRTQLAAQLPEYMVPGAFVVLDALPLTPNGKLDRRALPAPDASSVVTRDYEAPQGDIETALAAIWQQLLGLERVGRNDHFFELGGHSLLVVSLIEQLRQRGLRTHVQTVFTSPTLAAMAASVERGEACAFVVPANRIPAGCSAITPDMLPLVTLTQAEIARIVAEVPAGVADIQDIYPLAPLQEGILFHHLLGTEGDAYLMRTVLTFDARERLERFLGALQTVIDRHDILRSSVHWVGLPQAVQVVHREAQLPVQTVTLDAHTDALQQLLDATDPRTLRLDLQRAPLLRVYQAADPHSDAWFLSLINHHMVSDHVTVELLLEEIVALLQDAAASLAPSLPYRNFIAQTRAVEPADHEAYFRTQLADIDEPTAPFGVLDVQGDGSDAKQAVVSLEQDLAQRIRECAGQRGVTPAVLFHAAWAQVLARCTGRDDVVFGTVLSGRLQGAASADRVLGMFINTLPVRISVAQCSAAELVNQTYQRLSGLIAHEQASLALAQRCSAVPASQPLFTALLNYRHSAAAVQVGDAGEFVCDGVHLLAMEERTNYPVDLSVDDFAEGFALTLQCAPALDAQRIAAYLATAIASLVDALAGDERQAASALPILPLEERAQLLEEFNDTCVDYPSYLLIHQLVEDHAGARPDALAVACDGQQLTYRQLNARANQLAHRLISMGVRSDQRVALCVEHGIDMLTGLIGILKAGAAYVPLDPAYPAERVAYMIEDSTPVALVTQRALRDSVAGADALPVLLLDGTQTGESFDTEPTHNPDPQMLGLTAENLAYVIYTSGSTGKPKGVMVEHRQLVNYVLDAVRLFGLSAADVVMQQNSLNFDLSVEEIFPALAAGATLAPSSRIFGFSVGATDTAGNLASTDSTSSSAADSIGNSTGGGNNVGINSIGAGDGNGSTDSNGTTPRATFVHLTAAHWHTLVAEWHRNPARALEQLHGVRLVNVTGDALSAQKLA
ncbi:amino acid adenylation domain-containing protein, partial [Paraburkholderia jirisanensis]